MSPERLLIKEQSAAYGSWQLQLQSQGAISAVYLWYVGLIDREGFQLFSSQELFTPPG